MAITADQAKLALSFNMVDKTYTVFVPQYVQELILESSGNISLNGYAITDPLGDSQSLDSINESTLSLTFDIPLDSAGNVVNGAYDITGYYMHIELTDFSETYDFAYDDSSFTLKYTQPTIVLTNTINCISPSFVSTDSTDYRVIDPTSQGYITPTTVSYAHNLYYPVTSNGYPNNTTETSDLIITRGAYEFYQGTQTATVSRSVSYTFVDGLIVTDTIAGDLETKVDCATLTCDLTCGLDKAGQSMISEQGVNTGEFQRKQDNLILATTYASLAQFNINCGNSDMATYWAAQTKKLIGNCCTDCNAKDGDLICGAANPVFPYTPENVANKSQNITTDTGSTTKYPSVNAVQLYAEPLLGFTPEDVANKSTDIFTDQSSDTKYPSVKAVFDYFEPVLGFTPENVANKSTNVLLGTSNTLYPTQNAVKSYVDIQLPYTPASFLFTQAGTANPTLTTLQNNFSGVTFSAIRNAAGLYTITASSAIFSGDLTFVLMTMNYTASSIVLSANRVSATEIIVSTHDSAGASIDGITAASLEIRVYFAS